MRAGRSGRTGKPGRQRGVSPGHGSVPGCRPASPPVTPAAAHPAALAGVFALLGLLPLNPAGTGGSSPSPRLSRGSGGYRCHSGKSRWPNRSPSSAASQAGAPRSFRPSIPIPARCFPGSPGSGAGAAGRCSGSSRGGSGARQLWKGPGVGTGEGGDADSPSPARPPGAVSRSAPLPPNAPPGSALTGQPPAAALRSGPRHAAAATRSGRGRGRGRRGSPLSPPPPPPAGAGPWLRGGARRGRGGASAPGPAASRRRLPGFRPGAGLRGSCGGGGRSPVPREGSPWIPGRALADGPRG